MEHWMEVSSTVLQLVKIGALVPPEARDAPKARGYVRPSVHLAMLEDRARTTAFCEALKAQIGPDDVVVDIGTGTGVLATCAALAGARRVYAVESTAIADVAARVFAANGVDDRVHLVRERSTHATLPERATLLVTEMIGDDPLDELLLEVVHDAKQRLLTPTARVVPSAIDVFAVPFEVPSAFVDGHAFTPSQIARFGEAYGMSFAPLLDHRLGPTHSIHVKSSDVSAWTSVGAPERLFAVDLQGPFETAFSSSCRLELTRDVRWLGVVLAFRATLAPSVVLSTLPAEVDPKNHWLYALWIAFDHPNLPRGTQVEIDYSYDRATSTLRFVPL